MKTPMKGKIISASILAADFSRLGEEVEHVLKAGVDFIHFDVMDHHFVPNLSFGAVVCQSLRKRGITAPIDVHLMVENPQDFIEPFAEAGANLITFHPETVSDFEETLGRIREAGMKAGVAFNPDKSMPLSPAWLRQVDLILLMSVYPGFAGQAFIPESLEKIAMVRKQLDEWGSEVWLGVDGGIKTANMADVSRAGANFFVVGSGLFQAPNYEKEIKQMRQRLGLR